MAVSKEILIKTLHTILRPVVRFAIKHSLYLHDLIDCAKIVFIQIAREILEEEGQAATDSRVSVMTGVHRRDVRILSQSGMVPIKERNLAMLVMGAWQTDLQFLTKENKPKVLSFGTIDSDFYKLVQKLSVDVNPATILAELERVGAVEKSRAGVRLIVQSYAPRKDLAHGYELLSQDSEYLMQSVAENLETEVQPPNLHARTEYDKVRKSAIPEIKRWLLVEGHKLHQRARSFISRFDQDINPPKQLEENAKVVLGSFSLVRDAEKEEKRKGALK